MSNPAIPSKPSMTPAEAECFAGYLKSSRLYLEFGCGGSTKLAQSVGVKKLYAVESDRAWVDAVKTDTDLKPLVDNGSYVIHWANIGPTGEWGTPKDKSAASQWPGYSLDIWNQIVGIPDLILVDGRFRLSCALQSVARSSDHTYIAIHDFQRTAYWPILRYTNVVEQVDNLVILRRKQMIDAYSFAIECTSSLLVPA